MLPKSYLHIRFVCLLILSVFTQQAYAWVLYLAPGARQIYIQVGNGTFSAGIPGNNSTINSVSVNVPIGSLGNGTAQNMTSNSSVALSPLDGYAVCNPPNQVYIGGWVRVPGTTGNAVLSVTNPINLINSSGDTIPFSTISWQSTANGNPYAHIASGNFNAGTTVLANVAANTWVENCFSFSYNNLNIYPAGTYTGRATYTLSLP